MESVRDGVVNLPVEYHSSIDIMITATTYWSSIRHTDEVVKDYLTIHDGLEEHKEIIPAQVAYYDSTVCVDLPKIEPTIALFFHPSNTYTIQKLKNADDILAQIEECTAKAIGIS